MSNRKMNEDEFDLSEIIDEYEEDSELRKKIEAMKHQQDEQVSASYETQGSKNDSALSTTDTHELPIYEDQINRSSFSDEDGEPSISNHDSEYDKTLVIMDHQSQRSFHAENDDHSYSKDTDSVYYYDNREVDEEEITEADIEEFLEDNDKLNPKNPTKHGVDENKMNKIITYVIVGVVALVLVVGIGFGVKMMIDNVNDTKTVEEKDPNANKPITEPNEPTPDPEEDPDEPTTDNAKRIAEINGKIKANTAQIEEYNKQYEVARQIVANGTVSEDEYGRKQTEQGEVARNIGNIEKEIDQYATQYENECSVSEGEPSEECTNLQSSLDAKKAEWEALKQRLEGLNNELQMMDEKKAAYEKANQTIIEINDEVKRLNDENTQLTQELASLQ